MKQIQSGHTTPEELSDTRTRFAIFQIEPGDLDDCPVEWTGEEDPDEMEMKYDKEELFLTDKAIEMTGWGAFWRGEGQMFGETPRGHHCGNIIVVTQGMGWDV